MMGLSYPSRMESPADLMARQPKVGDAVIFTDPTGRETPGLLTNVFGAMCASCGETKPVEEFPLRDGGYRRGDCSPCFKAKKAAYSKRSRPRIRLYERRKKAVRSAYRRAYDAKHPEKRREYHLRQMAKPGVKERMYAKNKEWAAANPDKIRAIWQTRRAREKDAFVEPIDFAQVRLRDKGGCGICSLPVPPDEESLDHIIPLAKGGLHQMSNVQLAHLSCNKRKGARLGR